MSKVFHSNADIQDVCIFVAVTCGIMLAGVAPDIFLGLSPPCLITMLTGHHCWGCGMTRATLALMHGNIHSAWAYNPRVVIVFPLLCMVYLKLLVKILPEQLRTAARRVCQQARP